MRTRIGVLVALVLAVASLEARRAATFESITVANTAVGIAAATLLPGGDRAVGCEGRLETAQVRYRFDGTDPTASEGVLLEVGDVLPMRAYQEASALKLIRTGSTSGVLKVHCWR